MGRFFELDLFKLQLMYHHFLSRSLVIKIILVSVAVAALPFLASLREIDPSDGCDDVSIPSGDSIPQFDIDAVILDLMAGKWISPGDKALTVGRDSGSAAAAAMRRAGVLATVGSEEGCGGLVFRGASFDFVFSAGVDRAGAPARVVLEMERVLRPGRAGAVVAGPVRSRGLARLATPVASLLRVSDVVTVRMVNGSVPVAVVVFRKRGGDRSAELM